MIIAEVNVVGPDGVQVNAEEKVPSAWETTNPEFIEHLIESGGARRVKD